MLDANVGVFVGLDAVSCLLAALVATFFWRTHRLLPGRAYDILALAFAVLALSYLAVAVSVFDVFPRFRAVDALRAGGQFLAAMLLFLNYASRRAGFSLRVVHLAAAAASAVALVYLLLYLVVPPRAQLPDPVTYLPWLRMVEFALLFAVSYLVALEIEGRALADYQVPIAFLLLALSKYSVGLLSFHGVEDAVVASYAWRLAGLLVLLRVVKPMRRWPPAAA